MTAESARVFFESGGNMEQDRTERPIKKNDGIMLCPSCLTENDPLTGFCAKCGRPLSSLSTIDPLQRAYAMGWVYRKCVSGPVGRIALIALWLLLLSTVGTLLYRATVRGLPWSRPWDYLEIAFGALGCALYAALLYRVTKSYILKRRESRDEDESA